MVQEVVLYSHFSFADETLLSSLGLLYDRVILPLADWVSSGNEWAAEFLAHCPAVQDLVDRTRPYRESQSPLCKSLDESECALVALHKLEAKGRFYSYLAQQGVTIEQLLEKETLDEAFSALHSLIASSIIRCMPSGTRPVIVYSPEPGLGNSLAEKIADLLNVELTSFVVPHISVRPGALSMCRSAMADCEARYEYRSQLLTFGDRIATEISALESAADRRAVIRRELFALKASYDKWLKKLEIFRSCGWIEIRKGNDNLIHATRSALRSKKISVAGKFLSLFEFNVEESRQPLTNTLLKNEDLRELVLDITWQHHLYAYKTRLTESE